MKFVPWMHNNTNGFPYQALKWQRVTTSTAVVRQGTDSKRTASIAKKKTTYHCSTVWCV